MKVTVLIITFFCTVLFPYKTNLLEPEVITTKTIQYPCKTITKSFVLGKFDFKTDSCFVEVDSKFSNKSIYLQKEVYDAFLKMRAAAETQGIQFKIISGTRNFTYQKSIWDRKWKKYESLTPTERAKKILEYSSMPSTSRHHWGTDFDLNHLTNTYFENGQGLKAYNWLQKHANAYGFYQVYTSKDANRTGYNEEKWHWSYIPLAGKYLTFYNANITNADISGFEGAELASELDMICNYVNGISNLAKSQG